MKKEAEPNSKLLRTFFFISGITATIAYRIIIALNIYAPSWTNPAWYLGTIGFIIFFGHRYNVQTKRKNLIEKYNLIQEVETSNIKGKKQEALDYIIKTVSTSKSRLNSLFIFILSIAALIAGIIMDLTS